MELAETWAGRPLPKAFMQLPLTMQAKASAAASSPVSRLFVKWLWSLYPGSSPNRYAALANQARPQASVSINIPF